MSEETKHTELPWQIDEENRMLVYHEGLYKGSSNVRSDILTILQRDEPQRVCEANAAFVFRACTNYEAQEAKIKALLEVCKELFKLWYQSTSKCNDATCSVCLGNIKKKERFKAAIALTEKGV